MQPYCSERVLAKLSSKHKVAYSEVLECFANRIGSSLIDNREEHKTTPPTRWFIAETNMGRKIKVVYIPLNDCFEIKTAYLANPMELEIYQSKAKVSF